MPKFNPLEHPNCFSYPLRLAATAEVAHVSFAMTMVDLLRPRTIVELCTTDGILYCAFCQAVRELKLDARCFGICPGQPTDDDSQPDEAHTEWKKAHDDLYGGFSRLLTPLTTDGTHLFDKDSVDLLHLNGNLSYESARDEFAVWLPKLSGKSVVMLSDTNLHQGAPGINKLWEELKRDYPHFEFGQGRGLGLVAVGTDVPEGITALLTTREPELSAVREFFRQQGQRLKASSNGTAVLASGSDDQLVTTKRKIESLSASLEAETREVENRTRTFDAAVTELQAIQRDLEATEEALTLTKRDLDQRSSDLAQSSSQLEAIVASRAWRWVSRYGHMKNWLLGRRRWRRRQRIPLPARATDNGLIVGIDTKIPDPIVVGKGSALYVSGLCYHFEQKIRNLQLLVDGQPQQVKAFNMPRQDLPDDQFPDPVGNSSRSGFWAILTFPEIVEPTRVPLALQVTLGDGTTCREQLVTLKLKPGAANPDRLSLPEYKNVPDQPLVAVCMTTYEPPLDLFARQIESIRKQSHSNWVCIISDDGSRPKILEEIRSITSQDKRFHVFPGSARLGFYNNFERSISLAPDEAEYIALSDQDDYWHPDKLETLLSQFDESTTLVYSDMNIVDEKGTRIAGTYWTTRPNNFTNFASLLMANTITGAASLFHRRLLPYILPFPEKVGSPYHDHWIGCAALALGKVKFVDRALYDYVQHSANALGHFAPVGRNLRQRARGATLALMYLGNWLRVSLANWQIVYFYDLIREQLMCKVIELRCGEHLTRDKKKSLSRITHVDESASAFAWMATRGLKDGGWRRETLGAEQVFLLATIWKKFTDFKLWLGYGAGENTGYISTVPPLTELAPTEAQPAIDPPPPLLQTFSQVQFTQQKIAPLGLRISIAAPKRINLLIPNIDLKHFFGGYITKLNLARCLAEAGFNVRLVIVDICDYLPSVWRRQLQSYDGLEKLFDKVETVYAYDRTKLLTVSQDDVFMATTWWTAHIAHEAAKALKKSKFIYLIQEFEPFTFPMGTFASLANQTYGFPHYAIFSTELLRDYFRQNRLGVFSASVGEGEQNSISFQNCITSVGAVRLEEMAGRTPKKLLFYARPEAHAARNMFEMASLALSEAIAAGYFQGEWEFYGIGTVGTLAKVELSSGVTMTLYPRQTQEKYREVLREHDLGLSLMYTPHPSLVPIEMAAAGMLVVTNTYANKTADKLAAISSNIIAVEPTIEEIKQGLKKASDHIHDYQRRVQGSQVDWSDRWEDSFDEKVLGKIKEFVAAHQQR
jgi:glycosyltransferase involved in cell wall biosynthesis